MTEKIINNRGTACFTIRQRYPLSGTIRLREPVVDRVYNWEEGDVPKIPCQEIILGKEGLNEINMSSYSNI
jgi:hypothetical protein